MPAIENLLKRWGFVRLSRYGLVLTPEGRIMSLRPAVLDDGMGGRIVGWRDRDLAAAELSRWEPARPAPQKAVASTVATHVRVSPPIAARTIAPLAPPAPAPVIPAPAAAAAGNLAIYVAPAEEPEEDEWEWEIALARARVAAEEVAAAAPPVAPVRPSRRTRLDTVPPPPIIVAIPAPPKFVEAKTDVSVPPKFIEAKTKPGAVASPIDSGEWPKTEPLGNIDYEDYTNPVAEVVRVVRLAKPTIIPAKTIHNTTPPAPLPVVRAYPRAQSPRTVIPVPKLPRVDLDARQAVEPVVRTRFPKATPPALQTQRPSQNHNVVIPPPVRPAEDDKTSPGMMPAPIALPRIPGLKRAR
jgi:hypothetical protein